MPALPGAQFGGPSTPLQTAPVPYPTGFWSTVARGAAATTKAVGDAAQDEYRRGAVEDLNRAGYALYGNAFHSVASTIRGVGAGADAMSRIIYGGGSRLNAPDASSSELMARLASTIDEAGDRADAGAPGQNVLEKALGVAGGAIPAVAAAAATNGAALVPMFASQGMDQIERRAAANGDQGSLPTAIKTLTNGVVQGALGLIPGASFAEGVVPALASPLAATAAKVAAGTAGAAGVGAVMQGATNVLEGAPLTEAMGESAASLALMHLGALGARYLGRQPAAQAAPGPAQGAADTGAQSEPPPAGDPSGGQGAAPELDQNAPPPPPPSPSSSTGAPLDTDGRFPVTAAGHVVSDAGGPIQFDNHVDLARWILGTGQRQSADQRFEPDIHPQGGYTARERMRVDPQAAAEPDAVEPDAVPAAAQTIQAKALDDAAVGPARDGADYEAAIASLVRGEAPAPVEPVVDVDDILPGEPATAGNDAEPAYAPPPEAAPQAPPATTTYRGRAVTATDFAPSELKAAPDLFQYKAGGDAQGVTDRLQGVQTWDPVSAGRSLVWRSLEGEALIADGHQRLGLATRLAAQDPRLAALVFDARDGWSAQDVRTIAALKNIREGSGTPLDAAKVFRDQDGAASDDSLPVSGGLIAQAKGLAKLSDGAFHAVVNEVVPQNQAALIGNMAPDKPDLHDAMIGLLARAKPANLDEARALISESLEADFRRGEGETDDMFGHAPLESDIIARAKVRASVLRSVRSNAKLFSTLTRNADAIEAGGNALARDANELALASNRAAEALISKLANRAGDVGDAMKTAAAAVMDGKPVAEAAKGVLAKVIEHIQAADQAEAERRRLLDPIPPSEAAMADADLFGDVDGAGAKAQLVAKPEEAAAEAEVIATPNPMKRAATALKGCAP